MIWSTPMWNLFHTMCEKCEDDTEKLRKLYKLIQYLSSVIPCYSCKTHASNYLNKNKEDNVFLSKNNFKMFLYTFHNSVKEKKKIKLESVDVLNKYKIMNLNEVYLDTIKILTVLNMKSTHTVKINKLFIKIFGSVHTKGIDKINEDYAKDPTNKQKIFRKITENRVQTNNKNIHKLPIKAIETKKKIERNISIDISSESPVKPIESKKKIERNIPINKKNNSINTKSIFNRTSA